MRKLGILALAAAAAFAVSGPAQATDLMETMDTMASTPMMSDEYDWTGFYMGVYVGVQTDDGAEVGKLVGFNVETGNNIVFGAEARLGYVVCSGGCGFEDWNLIGRVGVDINEGLLLFASAGVGQQFFFGGPYDSYRGVYGVGLEYAASDNWSLRGQVEANRYFGAPSTAWYEATISGIWHLR